VNNVLWRVVAGRIRRGRGSDEAAGRQLDNPVLVSDNCPDIVNNNGIELLAIINENIVQM